MRVEAGRMVAFAIKKMSTCTVSRERSSGAATTVVA
jgi:hypothetical protein